MGADSHNRPYLQARIREEVARHARHGHAFSLLVFEAIGTSDGVSVHRKLDWLEEVLRQHVRPSDVIARAFEDTLAALLIETGAPGAQDALFRLRGIIARSGAAASWRLVAYVYPEDAGAIDALPLLTAA